MLKVTKLRNIVVSALALAAIACVRNEPHSMDEVYYERLKSVETDYLVDIFRKEVSTTFGGGHTFTNVDILLGKRGIYVLELISPEEVGRNPFYYDRLFENLAFYSNVDVCAVRPDIVEYAKANFSNGVRFDCENYRSIIAQSDRPPYGPFLPSFRR